MKKAAVFGCIKDDMPNIDKRYFEHIRQSGIEPRAVYPDLPEDAAEKYDCLAVCGGGDIHPNYYGEQPLKEHYTYDRRFDEYELATIRAFFKKKKPILGICRGMQSVNVALGGSLFQSVQSQLGLCHKGSDKAVCNHEIKISKNSDISKKMGLRAIVNSYHHQSINKPGDGLYVIAAAHDGVIEAFESDTLPVLGIQWHPERMNGNDVFDYFFEKYVK